MADLKIWVRGNLLRISIDGHDYHGIAAYGDGVIREEKHDPEGVVLTGNMLFNALTQLNGDNPYWKEKLRDLLRRGNVVSAIKLWSAHTGLGLKEAKDEVDLFRTAEGL